jgi:hypothetical protein
LLHRPPAALRAERPGVVVRLRQAAVADIRQDPREGTVDPAPGRPTDPVAR